VTPIRRGNVRSECVAKKLDFARGQAFAVWLSSALLR
jgi:hypothetical protein